MPDATDFAKLRRILSDFTRPELNTLIHNVLEDQLQVDGETSDDATSLRRTVDALMNALQSVEPLETLLTCIAQIHCFFVRSRTDDLKPWAVLRVSDTQKEFPTESSADALMDPDSFFDGVLKAFVMTTFEVNGYWELHDGVVYGCLLAQNLDKLPVSEELCLCYVVYAPGLPLLAVNDTGTGVYDAVVASLSRVLRPAKVNVLRIAQTDLRSSLQFACRQIGVPVRSCLFPRFLREQRAYFGLPCNVIPVRKQFRLCRNCKNGCRA